MAPFLLETKRLCLLSGFASLACCLSSRDIEGRVQGLIDVDAVLVGRLGARGGKVCEIHFGVGFIFDP